MRLGGEPESSNFEDRTGQGSSGLGGMGGGNALGGLINSGHQQIEFQPVSLGL